MAMSFYFFSLGTVVDSGVFAPVLTFQKLFEDEGVPITSDEVRAPMGVHKRVNIKLITLGQNLIICPSICNFRVNFEVKIWIFCEKIQNFSFLRKFDFWTIFGLLPQCGT